MPVKEGLPRIEGPAEQKMQFGREKARCRRSPTRNMNEDGVASG
jgi:hypothetical protein